ncbi:uncharacterized protein BCR38DRAFT_448403 [Pseudomassariella vexata]|uniref:Uncharacterized protein n=1 Tax=Pseudomassariella vexata TaxID=1141098 RepID=A0A1Y2DG25_9PEZI|nr:uncharacterized protein BCR38DRAFT_448403 [Pseudomassariella vexata]ORY58231.1 hypothetical protein BCR38DRAFT_448403 [Pseudomassariella vexata]
MVAEAVFHGYSELQCQQPQRRRRIYWLSRFSYSSDNVCVVLSRMMIFGHREIDACGAWVGNLG